MGAVGGTVVALVAEAFVGDVTETLIGENNFNSLWRLKVRWYIITTTQSLTHPCKGKMDYLNCCCDTLSWGNVNIGSCLSI